MGTIDIDNLFDHHRLPPGLFMIPVLVYFPIGIVLALIRLFIGLHAYLITCILPKTNIIRRFVIRGMCGVLGIWVGVDETKGNVAGQKVIVANYTSALDHLAVDLVIPNVFPCVWDLPSALMWMLGYRDMGAKKGRDTLILNAKSYCRDSKLPLLVFPEGASTNGKAGLLKYSIWPFSLDQPVLPIVIKVRRPSFVHIAPSILGGRWWADLMWFLFVPYSYFYIRTLPAETQDDAETVEEFTSRVQGLMAKALEIQPTLHTSADKVEYAKRKLFSPPSETTQASPARRAQTASRDPMVIMTNQVKEVLPHVPAAAIVKDLSLTKDVDLTITNILEGRVSYTPEEPSTEASPAVPVIHKNAPPAPTAAKSFGKSSKERHMSFDERKKALYDNARLKYMEKHGML